MRNVGIEFPARGQMAFYDLGAPPSLGPGQALLETLYSGITNGTERHGLMGDHGWDHYPGRHGYQHVCRVVALGEGTSSLAEGDVVFYGDYVGHRGRHVVQIDGAQPLVVRLEPELDLQECALLGVAGVAMRHVRRTRVSAGQRVLVLGVGPIGIFVAQCARAVGAHVTVGEMVDRRLQAASETGAHCVVDMREDGAWQELSAGGRYQAIFDGAGYDRFFWDIHEHGLIDHGCVIGAISVRSEAHFPWAMLHGTEASIEVSCHFSVPDLLVLLHLVSTGVVRIGPMISHRVGIEQAPDIYATMRDDPRALYGVVFDWVGG